jgi:hypothetical protein
MDGKRARRMIIERSGPEQRIEIGAVVWMAVADDHRIDLIGRDVLQQARQGRVAEVDDEPESVLFDQETAARPARLGPRHHSRRAQ